MSNGTHREGNRSELTIARGQGHAGGTRAKAPPGPVHGKPLSAAQRELVTANLGLVAVHIRRRVVGRGHRLRPDEYAEAFQVGCLGLIEAARQYRPERGIAFAAFALARIRTAIHQWLVDSTVLHVPRPRSGRRRSAESNTATCPPMPPASDDRPRVLPLTVEPAARGENHDAVPLDETAPAFAERMGDLLRARLDLAMERAVRAELRRQRPLATEALVRAVVAERISVPELSEQRPIRQLAERFGVSPSGVGLLEQRLRVAIRRALLGDRQFQLLRRWIRRHEEGVRGIVDEAMVAQLRAAAAEHFWTRLGQLDRPTREEMLRRLVREAGDAAVRGVFATLPPDRADVVLTEALLAA
jgi:RNA polymerase sigma factor (sigma-70 family)